MDFFKQYIRQNRKGILTFFLFCLIFLVIFGLYRLPVGAVLYPTLLCGAVGIGFLAADYKKAWEKHRQLREMAELTAELLEHFPPISSQDDADYQTLISVVREENNELKSQMNRRLTDMSDYYTTWAHQIKTPIASMRLTLQSEDSELSRKLMMELQRIEQYVDMVLCYLRLDSDTTDYVLRRVELDKVVRQAVHKFAGQFVNLGIRLSFQPLETTVVTDEKWLLFVVEQVLSNAIKYTFPGMEYSQQGNVEEEKKIPPTITIELETPKTLCIRDNGIGIAPEDLPRIFEKGYTGYNGRTDKKASGLGLYLCRRICNNLGHSISAQSVPGEGTTIKINLEQHEVTE